MGCAVEDIDTRQTTTAEGERRRGSGYNSVLVSIGVKGAMSQQANPERLDLNDMLGFLEGGMVSEREVASERNRR